MVSATDINLHRVLVGHRAAVNVVDFDEKSPTTSRKRADSKNAEYQKTMKTTVGNVGGSKTSSDTHSERSEEVLQMERAQTTL